MTPASQRAWLAASRGGSTAAVALDYGGTLTDPSAAVDPALEMRPITAGAAAAVHQLYDRLGLRLILASNTLPRQDRHLALVQAGVRRLFSHLVQHLRAARAAGGRARR